MAPSFGNFYPEFPLEVFKAAQAYDFVTLRALFAKVEPYYAFVARCSAARVDTGGLLKPGGSIYGEGNLRFGIVKEAMNLVGLNGGRTRLPLTGLTQKERDELREILGPGRCGCRATGRSSKYAQSDRCRRTILEPEFHQAAEVLESVSPFSRPIGIPSERILERLVTRGVIMFRVPCDDGGEIRSTGWVHELAIGLKTGCAFIPANLSTMKFLALNRFQSVDHAPPGRQQGRGLRPPR